MTQTVARRELRAADEAGFCGFCFAEGKPGTRFLHYRGCKAINDSGSRRKPRPDDQGAKR